jgi:hypothetical protein
MKLDIPKETALKLIEVLKQVVEEENEVEQKTENKVTHGITKEPKKQKASRKRKDTSKSERKKEIRCRVEGITTGSKENKFWELKEGSRKLTESHKEDSKIDKNLAGNYTQRKRRPKAQSISTKCWKCGLIEDISPSLIRSGGRYVCNECCTK